MHPADSPLPDTRAVLLTPQGRSAVATISVIGPRALDCVSHCFRPARHGSLRDAPLSHIVYGRWGGDLGEELVACRITEAEIELHCHGGHAAPARILADLATHCATVSTWQAACAREDSAWVRGAALRALTQSAAVRTAAILWDQYRGALAGALEEMQSLLVVGRAAEALAACEALLARTPLGLHLTEPWRVTLLGKPNVGKSSLLNALLGFGRAIVHSQPGTTRDLVTGRTAFGGWPCLLVDTAGLRDAAEPVEQAGVRLASEEFARADLIVWVRDAADALSKVWSRFDPAQALIVWNKCDLLSTPIIPPAGSLCVSAKTGEGLEELSRAIATRLVPNPPPPGAAVPFASAQVARLEELRGHLCNGRVPAAIAALASWLALRQQELLPGEIRE